MPAPAERRNSINARRGIHEVTAAVARAANGVLQQARDRHRADAARHGRHRRRELGGIRVDVADEPGFRPVHADVDDHRARLDHVRRHERGHPDGGDEHVGVERVPLQIARVRVAERHGRVRLLQQVGHRLADDVAAADHDRARAVELDLVLLEQRHHSARSRGDDRRPAEVQLAGVHRMEAVDVLRRRDSPDHLFLVEVRRQRQLDEDRVDVVGRVQLRELASSSCCVVSVGRRRSVASKPASTAALCLSRM